MNLSRCAKLYHSIREVRGTKKLLLKTNKKTNSMTQNIAGRLEISTFKAGFFSRVAHDLLLSVHRFTLEKRGNEVHGVFWTDSFHVEGIIEKGQTRTDILSSKDKRKILSTIQNEILHTKRFPEARIEGRIENEHFVGSLDLKGIKKNLSFPTVPFERGQCIRVEIRPSRWGIKPYKALMGALQLEDKIEARFIFEGDLTSQ